VRIAVAQTEELDRTRALPGDLSIAVPAQCAPSTPSAVAGPHGYLLRQARPDGPDVICVDLDRADPELDVALHKARPWRATARAGDIYEAARVVDPRSADRTSR